MTRHPSGTFLRGPGAHLADWFSRHAGVVGLVFVMAVCFQTHAIAQAGKKGTIFLEPDIIAADDPSTFVGLERAGQGQREIFDRRLARPFYATRMVHLFQARFKDMRGPMEVQVNLEFDPQDAAAVAEKYLKIIGQFPSALRSGLKEVTIHRGGELFAGGSRGIVIHTEQADDYASAGLLEEALVHEATHAVLQDHSQSDAWITAQQNDGRFISDYARERPEYEDVAESFLMYLAVRYRGMRISARTKQVVEETIPHRLAYFDKLRLDVEPMPTARQRPRATVAAGVNDQATRSQPTTAPGSPAGSGAFAPGSRYYKLQTRFLEGQNKCLEGNAPGRDALLGGAAHMDDCQRVSGQQWRFVPAADGYFKLQTMQLADMNLCLEGGNGAAHASPAMFRPCRDESGQFWKVEPANDGYFRLTTLFLEDKNLCLEGGSGVDKNSAAHHRPCRNVTGQLWKFSPN